MGLDHSVRYISLVNELNNQFGLEYQRFTSVLFVSDEMVWVVCIKDWSTYMWLTFSDEVLFCLGNLIICMDRK